MDDATRAAALERLQPLVGEWTAEFHFSFTPEPVAGWLSFAWELGGRFLLQRSGAEHPDAPSGLCVIAVAEEGDGHEYVQHYFDSRGVVRTYRMTLRDACGRSYATGRTSRCSTSRSGTPARSVPTGRRSPGSGRSRTTAARPGSVTSA